MNKNIIILICLLLVWTACKKKKTQTQAPKQYSTWIVNNHDTFHTNNVDSSVDCNPDHSVCRAILSVNNNINSYTLSFTLDYFPTAGNFELNTTTPGVKLFAFTFYYNSKLYYHTPSKIDTMSASSINNKASYNLPPSWFVNYDNPTGDSILIQGTFNLP